MFGQFWTTFPSLPNINVTSMLLIKLDLSSLISVSVALKIVFYHHYLTVKETFHHILNKELPSYSSK